MTPVVPLQSNTLRLFASPRFTLYLLPANLTPDSACIAVTGSTGDIPHYAINPISLNWFKRKIESMRKLNAADKLRVTDEMVRAAESFLVDLTMHTLRNWSQEQIDLADQLKALPDLPPVPPEVDVRERTADEWNDWILNHERRWDEERDQSQSARDAESGKKPHRRGGKRAISAVGDSEGE
jgi:hypothetical protein